MLRLSIPLSLVVLTGCAYYNGMYNANRYASQAEQSERAGRPVEAADRWQLAEIHAESMIARHPDSRWTGEAWLVRGRAQVALHQYGDAAVSLAIADSLLAGTERGFEAQLQLGRANLALKRLPEARAALDSAAQSSDGRRRSRAQLYRGRVLLLLHRPAEALADFGSSREAEARFERARAALLLGDADQAAVTLDSVARGDPFREEQWLPLLDSLDRAGRSGEVRRITDALLLRADVGFGPRARLAAADAARGFAAFDTARATGRLLDAMRMAPDSAEGHAADLSLLKLALDTLTSAAALDPVREHLARLAMMGGQSGMDAAQLLRAATLADTLGTAPGARDAWWFFRAEVLRDSLGARRLAAAAFAEMPARFPDSPWSPKAALAAIVAGCDQADSLRALLAGPYAASPYAAIALARPVSDSGYAALEDSLARTLLLRPGARGPALRPVNLPAPTPARPGTRPIDP